MKYKTAELEGDALDYLVRCIVRGEQPLVSPAVFAAENDEGFSPSTRWDQGGPIIERELIGLEADDSPVRWYAELVHAARDDGVQRSSATGPTTLIATMRAFVTAKYGPEIELPD